MIEDGDEPASEVGKRGEVHNADKNIPLRFAGALLAIYLLFFSVSRTDWFQREVAQRSLRVSASIAAEILTSFGEDATAIGDVVLSPRFSLRIADGCDALEPLLLFWAAILASPVFPRVQLVGVIGGGGVLLLVNQLRVVSLYYAGIYMRTHADFIHINVWPVLFVATSLVVWLLWAVWAIRSRSLLVSQ